MPEPPLLTFHGVQRLMRIELQRFRRELLDDLQAGPRNPQNDFYHDRAERFKHQPEVFTRTDVLMQSSCASEQLSVWGEMKMQKSEVIHKSSHGTDQPSAWRKMTTYNGESVQKSSHGTDQPSAWRKMTTYNRESVQKAHQPDAHSSLRRASATSSLSQKDSRAQTQRTKHGGISVWGFDLLTAEGQDRDSTRSPSCRGTCFNFRKPIDKQTLTEPDYHVENLYSTSALARIVTSNWFNYIISSAILLNAIFIGVSQDYNDAEKPAEAAWPYQVCEHTFCTIFTTELLMRLLAFKRTRWCIRDFWFKFDALQAVLMVFETWMLPCLSVLVGEASYAGAHYRLLRLIRICRMSRVAWILPELVTMVKGMKIAARAVLSSMVMLLLQIFCFGVLLNTYLKESVVLVDYFETLPLTMWTLLMDGTLLDSPGVLLRRMRHEEYYSMMVLFMSFVCVSAMLVMNMLVGILCEVVSATAQSEKDAVEISMVKRTLLVMLQGQDTDDSGTINYDEFVRAMEDDKCTDVLCELEVDLEYFQNYATMLFAENHELPIADLINLVVKLRGECAPKMRDLTDAVQYLQWWMVQSMDFQASRSQQMVGNTAI